MKKILLVCVLLFLFGLLIVLVNNIFSSLRNVQRNQNLYYIVETWDDKYAVIAADTFAYISVAQKCYNDSGKNTGLFIIEGFEKELILNK